MQSLPFPFSPLPPIFTPPLSHFPKSCLSSFPQLLRPCIRILWHLRQLGCITYCGRILREMEHVRHELPLISTSCLYSEYSTLFTDTQHTRSFLVTLWDTLLNHQFLYLHTVIMNSSVVQMNLHHIQEIY